MQDECGDTALCAACQEGCYDPAVLLIDHGADVNYLTKVIETMHFMHCMSMVNMVEWCAQFRARWGSCVGH